MREIVLNNVKWHVIRVPPNNPYLVDRSNVLTIGTTDPISRCIYIADNLYGELEKKVIAHEIGHAVCFSYGLLNEIHRYCYPEHWIDMEEFICNFVADYGEMIWDITKDIAKVPIYLEKLIS